MAALRTCTMLGMNIVSQSRKDGCEIYYMTNLEANDKSVGVLKSVCSVSLVSLVSPTVLQAAFTANKATRLKSFFQAFAGLVHMQLYW